MSDAMRSWLSLRWGSILAVSLVLPGVASGASFVPAGSSIGDFYDLVGSINGELARNGMFNTTVSTSNSNMVSPNGLIASGETSGGMIDPVTRRPQSTFRGTQQYVAEVSSELTSEILAGPGGTTRVSVGVESMARIDAGYDAGSFIAALLDTSWILDLTSLPGPTKFSWKTINGATPLLLDDPTLPMPGMISGDMVYPGQYLIWQDISFSAQVQTDGEAVNRSASALAVLTIGIVPLPSVAGLGSLGLFVVAGRRSRRG